MNYYLAGASNNVYQAAGSWIVPMTAGDTAYMTVAVYNGAKTVSYYAGGPGSGGIPASFSGCLIC